MNPMYDLSLDGYGPALEPPDDYYFLPRGAEQTEDQEDEEYWKAQAFTPLWPLCRANSRPLKGR